MLAIARAGSLKGAASRLGVNISTVARRLDAFEGALGIHLFDRTPDGTLPTAAVEQLMPFAEAMEQAALGMANALDGFEAEPEGLVRMTAPPGIAEHFVAPAIGQMLERHPKLTVELSSSIGYADLSRREADIALRIMRPRSGDLVAKRLGGTKSTVIASRARQIRDLDEVRWITYEESLGHLPETAWITRQVSPERIVLRSNSLTAHLSAVQSGLGVTVASRAFLALYDLQEVRLSRKLAKTVVPFPESALWLVGHRALRDVPRVAAVWSFIEEQFEAVLQV